MADILYTYNDNVYVNLTNKCDCACRFCIRSHHDGVGDADTLWHKADPTLEEIKAAIDAYDFTGKKELVYCGYGEPPRPLANLVESPKYARGRGRGDAGICQGMWEVDQVGEVHRGRRVVRGGCRGEPEAGAGAGRGTEGEEVRVTRA